MKAIIKTVTFSKEFETKFGTLYGFKITYNDKVGYYNSKTKEQTKFIAGKEAEFEEEVKSSEKGEFISIKPIKQAWTGNSNYGKAVKKEQSKYSGFAVSYVKDLIIADKLKIEDWEKASKKIFNFMVELDKSIEQ